MSGSAPPPPASLVVFFTAIAVLVGCYGFVLPYYLLKRVYGRVDIKLMLVSAGVFIIVVLIQLILQLAPYHVLKASTAVVVYWAVVASLCQELAKYIAIRGLAHDVADSASIGLGFGMMECAIASGLITMGVIALVAFAVPLHVKASSLALALMLALPIDAFLTTLFQVATAVIIYNWASRNAPLIGLGIAIALHFIVDVFSISASFTGNVGLVVASWIAKALTATVVLGRATPTKPARLLATGEIVYV